ncbi:hypothetical protein FRC00_007102 [Tulasnella sp. 408]|nr:hypothetical protein FRC00_007102 [Tulasnella sp. 408]
MPTASEYDQPVSGNVQRVYNQGRIDPYDNAVYDPPLKAFNDLCTITSHYNTRLLKFIEDKSSRAYNLAAWAIGMPRQMEFDIHKSAVIVMNAGAGMGLSLSLALAEDGYKVLGLVHEDLGPAEAGSVGRLVYIWGQRKASILAKRQQKLDHEPYTTFPELGEIVPFPFNPLSEASRKTTRQSVLAYCHLHSLHLRSLILAPVFAAPLTRGGPLGEYQEARVYPPTPTMKLGRSLEENEWEIVIESDDPPRTIVANGLASHPPLKHSFYANDSISPAAREGSFLPIHLAHQDVIQRALDREFKEQVIVAGLFGDIIGNPPKFEPYAEPEHGKEGESTSHWETKDIRYTPVEPLPKPETVWPPPVPGMRTHPSKPIVSRPPDPDARAGRNPVMSRWTQWPKPIRRNSFEAFWDATRWKLNVLPSKTVATATIIWLTGCGEGSFVGAQGFSRAIDAAREEMGLVADGELGDMGARVSIVKTEWDPRTRADAKTPEFLAKQYHQHFSRANLLARLSALWAIEDHAVYWIVKRAIHAPYHKRTYSFGLDVMVRDFISFVPDPLWQLLVWVIYENLGLRAWEMWMTDKEYMAPRPIWSWLWMFVPSIIVHMVFFMLSWWADNVREPDFGWRMD